MQKKRSLSLGDFILLVIFSAVVISSLILVLSGSAFIVMVPENMALILSLLVPVAAMLAGVIFTYSIAQYSMQKQFRHLALVFMALNMILTSILYYLTNVSMMSISPFADQARNRTIVAAFSLVLAPSVLFVGVSEEIQLNKKRVLLAILWGLLLSPLTSLWFMFSPEPVFRTTYPGGGMTPAAYLILVILLPTFSVALWRYYTAWKSEGNRLDLAAFLGILIWLHVIGLYILQSNPLQFMELIWFTGFICGELLIAIVTVTIEIIEPQKALYSLVDLRTEQLKESKKEIEFYLNIWGHKIGNLLQSIVLYLEMFSTGERSVDELSKLADTALLIGSEANQINRQVAALIKLKEQEDYELDSILLNDMLASTFKQIESNFGSHCITASESISEDAYVYGDEFIELALVNLFSFICKLNPNPNININFKIDSKLISLLIYFDGPRIPKDIEDSLFSLLQPARTSLSLDLFTVKILMQRFDGFFHYDWLEKQNHNLFTLNFNRVLKQESDLTPTQKHRTTTDG